MLVLAFLKWEYNGALVSVMVMRLCLTNLHMSVTTYC